MKKLLESIATRIKYINSNSTNAFVLKECKIVDTKLDDFRNRTIETQEEVDSICDKIVNYDIYLMKRVPGESNMVYKKMDELAGFIEEIKTLYFK